MDAALQYLDPDNYFSPLTTIRLFHHPSLKPQSIELEKAFEKLHLKEHYGVFSSGTSSSGLKGYVHSIDALESNARAVNDFLSLTSSDNWALSLPDYHIGGLQVLLRARLSGARVVDARGWDPVKWRETLERGEVSVTSIVPTQLYDLIKLNLTPPAHLRYLIVGGDFLSQELEKRARTLGWPVIRTFGMTEVASQIASSSLESSSLKPLPIHELKITENNSLLIKTPALFNFLFREASPWEIIPVEQLLDSSGLYQTQDEVRLENGMIIPLGRSGDYFKSGGHLIRLGDLRETLQKFLIERSLFSKAEVYFQDDERKGKRIILLHENLEDKIIALIQDRLDPVKIDELKCIAKIDRTVLGKTTSL